MDAHISKPMDYDILCRTLMRLIPAAPGLRRRFAGSGSK